MHCKRRLDTSQDAWQCVWTRRTVSFLDFILTFSDSDSLDRGVFTDSKLGMVLYYHYADRSGAIGDGSKKFGWNALSWSNGWPVV